MRLHKSAAIPRLTSAEPELLVVEYIATRRTDRERGPKIWLHPKDAQMRLVVDGELVWIYGQRGAQQLAPVEIDETVAEYTCVLRDIVGILAAERVRVVKPDLDTPQQTVG